MATAYLAHSWLTTTQTATGSAWTSIFTSTVTDVTYGDAEVLVTEIDAVSNNSCAWLFAAELAPPPYQDISGTGVVVSFLISAYIVLLPTLFAYAFGLLPPAFLNAVDTRCFRVNSKRSNGDWIAIIRRTTLIISDQQILTGIGILIAGFASFNSLDVFHWQVMTYLAWMSSNVHLVTLTLLREYLQENPVLRRWRVCGMLVLLVLLLLALVPAVRNEWTFILESAWPGSGIPVRCIWYYHEAYDDDPYNRIVNPTTLLSYVLIIFSYSWKISQLYPHTGKIIDRWLRAYPEWRLERAAKHELVSSHHRTLGSRIRYRAIVSLYTLMLVVSKLFGSFAVSLWLLAFNLVWGTLQITLILKSRPEKVLKQEASWNFGQILPLCLLLQPIAAVIEHISAKKEVSLESDEPNSSLHDSVTEVSRYDRLSDVLRSEEIREPAARTLMNSAQVQVEFVCSSKTFVTMVWLLQIGMLGSILFSIMFGFSITGLDAMSFFDYGSWVLACSIGILGLYLGIASFFSKLFR